MIRRFNSGPRLPLFPPNTLVGSGVPFWALAFGENTPSSSANLSAQNLLREPQHSLPPNFFWLVLPESLDKG